MFLRVMLVVWQFVLNLVSVMRMTEGENDFEIMLLRRQLRIVTQKQQRGTQVSPWQKVPLAVLVVHVKEKAMDARIR